MKEIRDCALCYGSGKGYTVYSRDDYIFVGTMDGVDNATAAANKAYILQEDGKFHLVTTGYPAATVPAGVYIVGGRKVVVK